MRAERREPEKSYAPSREKVNEKVSSLVEEVFRLFPSMKWTKGRNGAEERRDKRKKINSRSPSAQNAHKNSLKSSAEIPRRTESRGYCEIKANLAETCKSLGVGEGKKG
jgi:hypothetical protein